MRSPGRPDPSRTVQRQFWRLIATGITSAEAALKVGVSVPVGTRWFRHAGGMPPLSLAEPTRRYLSFEEREEIALLKAQDKGVREIASEIGRDPGTVSRELRRNAATRGGRPVYRAVVAQWKAQQSAKRPKTAKLVQNDRLREYVQDRLAENVRRPDGTVVPGPRTPPWKGLNKPHRQDRRWSTAWSPEQIAQRLKVEFPDDESMRISHEAIYQSLFIEGRGALKRELVTCLRTGRALREPRARSRNKAHGHVTADVVLSERPAEAEDRAVPGHWEGDLIIGTGRSAIGTIVERSSRSTLLVHLPRMEGWGDKPYVKNGPSLGGYGAVAMNAALTASMTQAARAVAQDPDVGSRQGAVGARAVCVGDRDAGVLRRSTLAVAAAEQREHERPTAPVLSKGHRPLTMVGRGPRGRRSRAQQSAPQDPRLEDAS
jgi:IS30 family transposase